MLNTRTAQYEFYEVLKVWWIRISYSYDILSLSEMAPSACYIETQ